MDEELFTFLQILHDFKNQAPISIPGLKQSGGILKEVIILIQFQKLLSVILRGSRMFKLLICAT